MLGSLAAELRAFHFVSQATSAAVQYIPETFPEVPVWHSGKVGSAQVWLVAQMVVQAAKSVVRLAQLKHVVPPAQG